MVSRWGPARRHIPCLFEHNTYILDGSHHTAVVSHDAEEVTVMEATFDLRLRPEAMHR